MDFALVMECELQGDTIDFRATFDHQILREEEVRRIFQQMADILRRMSLGDSDTRIKELQRISEGDREQIGKWNSTTDNGRESRWLVDPEDVNSLTPIGGVGEILIGTTAPGDQHLDNGSFEVKKFTETPTWYENQIGQPERKFYKTGVLAKYSWDGAISHIGRKENLVEIHGQRVDITEVETHVKEAIPSSWSPTPVQFAVTAVSDGEGKKVLATFFVAGDESNDGSAEDIILPDNSERFKLFHKLVEEIDTKLHHKLPEHTVPLVSTLKSTLWLRRLRD
jgi:acyl-CoA synthetase (AMP-forming)/AMP-acid ligase II